MAKDTEIPVQDDELDALMAELEAETADAVAPAPTAAPTPAPTPTPTAAPTPAPTAAPVLELPKGKDPLADQPSNFVMPAKPMVAVDDPLPWEESALAAEQPVPEPVAEVAKPVPVAVKPVLASVPPSPAPAAVNIADNVTMTPNPNPRPAPLLQHSIDVSEFKAETAVSDINLNDAMMKQSSLRATYGELAARAEAQASRVKVQVEVKEAELYDTHRKLLASTGEKVTEKAVENAVKMDKKWLALQNRKIDADTIADINKSLVRSLEDRRDMIIQLGADRREEGKGQVRIMADRDVRERAIAAART
jgi:hypothetical protein